MTIKKQISHIEMEISKLRMGPGLVHELSFVQALRLIAMPF